MIKTSFILSCLLMACWLAIWFFDPSAKTFLKKEIVAQFSFSSEPEFKIKINKVGLMRLDRMAQDSLKRGFLTSESRQWVPCKVIKDETITKCKIRLRGDLPKHWEGIKRSYRLKFKETSPIWGWKKVDLILPEDKGNESELVAYGMAKQLKLIAPGAKFSNISLNGINTGTYLVKQGDSGSLFEVNGRTESMLIKENNIWWYAQNAGGIYNKLYRQGQWDKNNLRALPILYAPTFQGKAATPLTFSRFAQMLEMISQGKNPTHHLNQKSFYQWVAIAMSFGSIHSTLPDNLLWYANGSTGLIEPVIYDILNEKLWGDPFYYFTSKSFILRNIFKATWGEGGKQEFRSALNSIEQNIKPAYLAIIESRNALNNSIIRRDDFYSESSALDRLKSVESNIQLIKAHIEKTSF